MPARPAFARFCHAPAVEHPTKNNFLGCTIALTSLYARYLSTLTAEPPEVKPGESRSNLCSHHNNSIETITMGTTLESTATDQKDGTKTTVSPVTPPSPQYLSSWRLYLVIACLFFGAFLIALDTNIINVAIPKISSEFHSLHDVAWYGTAYLLTITAFQPIYGSLYKYFETTMIYRSSIIVFERMLFLL